MESWWGSGLLYSHVVAKAWADDAFRAKLKSKPKKVLEENGIVLPKEIKVTIDETAQDVTYKLADHTLILPLPGRPADLDQQTLSNVLDNWPDCCFIFC